MNEKFTWVQTHKELVRYLADKENQQDSLIEILRRAGITPLNDEEIQGTKTKLTEIDPFTFFCYIYKYGPKRRLELLQKIAQQLNITKPLGESGIPSANAQSVWLFPYKYLRQNNEIKRLWALFYATINNQLTDEIFNDVLNIKNVAKTKLTEALFNVKPDEYLPINGPLKPYIEQELGIKSDFNSFSEYIKLLNHIKKKTKTPFYELSHHAWEWNNIKNNMNDSSKFSDQLIAFIEQAKTNNLKTKHYIKKYKGTSVKVSFGQGFTARVPWISFLKEPNITSNGIYPVYLFYKDLNKLILAYGISETNVPSASWNIQNPKSISSYFIENKLGKPDRYGASYIHKVYDLENLPSKKIIDDDLNSLIEFYTNNSVQQEIEKKKPIQFTSQSLIDFLENAGLFLNSKLVIRVISSLITKPFVILTGLSGSGKTKLAQAFVQWICQDESQYRIIPVGADWTNREPLLGYPNALRPEEYVKPDSGVLDLIIQANDQPDLPHFLILDEMNLSHVERYFADFLSVMESKKEIPLHAEGAVENGVPAKLKVPSNLFIIGTVNIDETTNMFSPKVLDRANTIEFRVTQDEMKSFLGNIKNINMDALTGKGAGMAKSFLDMAANMSFATTDIDEINAALVRFFGELKKTGAEFGYRSATEILRLINQLTVLDNTLSTNQKIDIAIMQKLLPKLHGSRRKLCPVLEMLGSFCVNDNLTVIKDVFGKDDFDFENHPDVLYRLSLEKIARMHKGAIDNGFASFAEA